MGIVVLFAGFVLTAQARSHKKPTPPSSTPSPVSTSTLQWGVYTNNKQAGVNAFAKSLGITPEWQMLFAAPRDGFPTGFTGNLVIFLEPRVDDASMISGSIDSQLTAFAKGAAAYSGQIILPLNEEVNCSNTDAWGGTFKGNTAASAIAAFQHIENVIKPIAPNIKFAYDVNNVSCYSSAASNSLTAYYPGNAYVDIVGVDGFNFGGQKWAQVFDSALRTLKQYGKPLWILSEGSTQNKSQFISDTFSGASTYGLSGFLYFNANVGGGNWTLDSTAMSTLKSLAQ